MERLDFDFLIIGAGIAGASLAYFLAPHGRVAILEREAYPAYHSTGRSAAMLVGSLGTAQVRGLTAASRDFFDKLPPDFSTHPLLKARAILTLGNEGQTDRLQEYFDGVLGLTKCVRLLTAEEAQQIVPVLRADLLAGAVLDPTAADIDVHALHQGYLRGLRNAGGQVFTNADVTSIEREAGQWIARTLTCEYRAPVLVNASRAWCDEVAALAGIRPLGLVPKRRAAFLFAPGDTQSIRDWPLCSALDETWYMKPEAGLLLGSPANQDPTM